ncbi:HD domain-containing protein [Emticicia sp. BO119]|uniref:HD domain-containing protein n=1 Tax=Emticicia sp. BO119 TaxID=2757768 RepID=UPI0015F07FDD|nr:HD domain-containing protein [Emticicia sp. BO119]MBA4850272.1 HD domain-containing protein [Emticicia sp. BO119]
MNPLIEDLLQEFQSAIGADYDKYRNHVYRVFLNCLLLDTNKNNEDKYAIAAVFHDIGIWTNHTFDYLAPSIEQAKIYLIETNKQESFEEIKLMIDNHHKLSSYKHKYPRTVETFRQADWIDVSFGILTFGADKQAIQLNKQQFSTSGFHRFLIKATTKNFLKHPANPLPMFRK